MQDTMPRDTAKNAIDDLIAAEWALEHWPIDWINPQGVSRESLVDRSREAHTAMLTALARLPDADAAAVLAANPDYDDDGEAFPVAQLSDIRRHRAKLRTVR